MHSVSLRIPQRLRPVKGLSPKYGVKVKARDSKEVICADPRATRALVALMDMAAVNGGAACHWGGPAAAAEALSAIHSYMFSHENWYEHFNFVNDIGHAENGIYALQANWGYGGLSFEDLLGFRSIESKLTGHGESHLYPEGVLLSNGPLSSAVGQAQGLAMADKLSANKRATICMISDGASMEGEAKEAFQAIPGLMNKGKLNPFILVLSDNNTKLSGRIDEDSYAMSPSFEAMETLGWKVVKIQQGNDLQACFSGLEQAMELAQAGNAVFLWVKTIKGYGVKSTEESASGGHGFPLKAYSQELLPFLQEIWSGEELPEEFGRLASRVITPASQPKQEQSFRSSVALGDKSEKTQAGLAKGAIQAAQEGYPIVSVSSDLQGSTGMSAFHKEFPARSFDIGIAESNMVSAAAGMSKLGYIPIVDTFAAFGVTKGNLPLIMSSLSEAPLIAVFSHAGFQDAADGASHQSLTYLSAVSSIPGVRVVIPATSGQAQKLMLDAIKDIKTSREEGTTAHSYIFFVGRESFPVCYQGDEKVCLGRAQTLIEGSDALVVATGPMVEKALKAQAALYSQGVKLGVVNLHSINFGEASELASLLRTHQNRLITIEDHQDIGGLGAQLVHRLKQEGAEFAYKSIAVRGQFGRSAYSADELYAKYEIDENAIIKAYNEFSDREAN